MEVVHMSKVIKVGNSHAIVLPVAVMLGLEIERGDHMIFAIYAKNTLTARKLEPDELRRLKPLPVIN